VLNHGHATGTLINSFREGIITLIPKVGKTSATVKDWRPITLLNTDFKIISAAVTARMKSIMEHIISPAQSAYIKGRYIGENSRLVYDTIDVLNETNKSGLIIAADFESAFESVSWKFLSKALDLYNFGAHFKSIIHLLCIPQ